MTRRVVHAVLIAMLASWASTAAGHDTWLLPARFDLPAGGRIMLDLTSGMGFPAPGSSIQPNRLAATGLRIAGRTLPLDAGNPDKTVKLAKTFVRVGQPTADQSWREPVGLALEIVPLADPTTLLVGSELSVRVEPAP
jgi:uncharacterized GH25 family protein